MEIPDDARVEDAMRACQTYLSEDLPVQDLIRWMRVLERTTAYTWLSGSIRLELTLLLSAVMRKSRQIGRYIVVNEKEINSLVASIEARDRAIARLHDLLNTRGNTP